jgi:hypothetical protein
MIDDKIICNDSGIPQKAKLFGAKPLKEYNASAFVVEKSKPIKLIILSYIILSFRSFSNFSCLSQPNSEIDISRE